METWIGSESCYFKKSSIKKFPSLSLQKKEEEEAAKTAVW